MTKTQTAWLKANNITVQITKPVSGGGYYVSGYSRFIGPRYLAGWSAEFPGYTIIDTSKAEGNIRGSIVTTVDTMKAALAWCRIPA